MALARSSVASGVTGKFFSRYSGWNIEKCTGTSVPRFALTHFAIPRNSCSLSLSVGTTRYTISVHIPSLRIVTSASSTGFISPLTTSA